MKRGLGSRAIQLGSLGRKVWDGFVLQDKDSGQNRERPWLKYKDIPWHLEAGKGFQVLHTFCCCCWVSLVSLSSDRSRRDILTLFHQSCSRPSAYKGILKIKSKFWKSRCSFFWCLKPGLKLLFVNFHHPSDVGLPRVGILRGSQKLYMHFFRDWFHVRLLLGMRDQGYVRDKTSPSQPNNYFVQVCSSLSGK